MKLLILLIALLPINIFAQNKGSFYLDSFSADEKDSTAGFRISKTVSFPEEEFSAKLAKKHYQVLTKSEYEGKTIYPNLTKHSIELEAVAGNYTLSFSFKYFDKDGNNIVDMISEVYFDGVLLDEPNEFKASLERTCSFNNGAVTATISNRGSYDLIISFKDKPLYGFITQAYFTKKY